MRFCCPVWDKLQVIRMASMSCLGLALTIAFASDCVAQSSDGLPRTLAPPRIFTPPRVQSWVVEPYMSQEEEQAIWNWLRSRPQLFKSITSLREFSRSFHSPYLDQSHFPIVLNAKAMEEIGIDVDDELRPVGGVAGYPKGTDLFFILESHDLTCVVRHGKLEVTTTEDADSKRVVRVYDVTPLLSIRKRDGKSVVDLGPLMETIYTTIAPETWEMLGGQSTMSSNILNNRCLLTVSTPTLVQIEVQQLLDQLAMAGGIPESKFLPSVKEVGPELHKPIVEPVSSKHVRSVSIPDSSSDSIPKSVW